MIGMTLLAAWLTLMIAPQTPIGRWLRRALVVAPAAHLARIRRETVLVFAILITLGIGSAWLFGGDATQLLRMAAPEIAHALIALDIVTYLDAALTVAIAATTMRWSGLRIMIARALGSGTRRTRRPPRVQRMRPAANEDDDRGMVRLAA